MAFKIVSENIPKGDQPQAIKKLIEGLDKRKQSQVLLGVTGSGKTFTIANVIEKYNRPTLIMAPNKTLAAQLYEELKILFPENAVEYFVSYYDYYQPEAYVPRSDTSGFSLLKTEENFSIRYPIVFIIEALEVDSRTLIFEMVFFRIFG